MAISDTDKVFAGMGMPGPAVDSGVVASTTTPKTITLTVPLPATGAAQPLVQVGRLTLALYGLNASAVVGTIDVQVSDGTNTEFLNGFPTTTAATAGQGGTYSMSVFSALLNITTIKTIAVIITTTGSNVFNADLRFNPGEIA